MQKVAALLCGRDEQCGIRCVYHGWKFKVHGECVDIPNIIPPDNFPALKEKARITSYPVREAGGIAWVYMGPQELMPELAATEWLTLPQKHGRTSRSFHRTNRLQSAECEIDTSHITCLLTVLNA